jgi:hypothetical protein
MCILNTSDYTEYGEANKAMYGVCENVECKYNDSFLTIHFSL